MARKSSVFKVDGELWKTCPNSESGKVCGHKGPIDKDFGWRIMRGKRAPQSWCFACRGLGERLDGTKRDKSEDDRRKARKWNDYVEPKPEVKPEPRMDTRYAPKPKPNSNILTCDEKKTEKQFDYHFPNDKFGGKERAWMFMARALRDKLTVSKEAQEAMDAVLNDL